MAKKTYTFNINGEKTFQTFDGTNTDEEARDAGQGLKNNGATKVTVEKPNGNIIFREGEETPESEINQGDVITAGKELGRAVRNALVAHGDEIADMKLANTSPEGVTVKVYYKKEEDATDLEGDEFKFAFKDGKVKLVTSKGEVDVCPLDQQSGTLKIQKDLVQDTISKLIKDNTVVKEQDEEALWECDAAQQSFLEAIDNFKTNGKNKETVKQLLKSARGFKNGDTIQEKFKNAAGWYNIYKENPPQNTKEQVFLENEETFDVWKDVFDPINKGLENLKNYINKTEDTWIGSYYRPLRAQMDKLQWFYQTHADRFGDEPESLDETEEGGDDEYEYPEDDPKTRYKIGDNTYRFVEWFGFKALLQNIDDDRDFELVTPEELRNLEKKENVQ